MDRVNRHLLFASTLLAVPAALLMATLTMGTTPDVQQAVVHGDTGGNVQQVVGKQIESRPSRPGLLKAIAEGQSSEGRHHHHNHHQHRTSPPKPKGLLDGLFDGGSSRSTHHSSSTHRAGSTHHSSHSRQSISAPGSPSQATASHSQTPTKQSTVDWDGVPYHKASTATTHGSSQAPIRDPKPVTASSAPKTRIIRGGSTRPVPARTASVRRSDGPTVAREPAPALPTPTAKKIEPISQATQNLSSSSRASSRRSGRRSVGALDASEIAAASRRPVTKSEPKPLDEVVDLIPRVTRKEVQVDETKPEASTKSEPVATSTEDVAASDTPEAKSSEGPLDPEKNTALAAIGAPTATTTAEPESAADVAENPASSGGESSPAPAYTTPVDPATSPLPIAGIPTHPYAASTPAGAIPAATASHRAGPPVDAFGSAPIDSSQPRLVPSGQPTFNAASMPVGSGVVPNSDVASYRRPSPENLQPIPATNGPIDPYAGANASPRLSTNGQLFAEGAPVPAAAPPSTTIPMHPINGYGPQAGSIGMDQPQAADNFAKSTPESRNRMRDPANGMPLAGNQVASELPGIRVVTHGPSAIMIRQTSQYEIRVENRGSIDAKGLIVRAAVPDWADLRGQNATRGDIDTQTQGSTERLVWTIDHLPAGATEQMFVRLTAAKSGTYDLDVDWTLLPQKSVARVQVREPRLDLTIEGPDEVTYGQSQTYKVRVLNPGDGIAPNVVFTLSPNSATPQTQRIGDIPPGKEAQFDVELTAQDLGDLKIHGLAAGDLELRAESAKTIRVAAARLEAVLSGPELKYQNTEAMYNLQLHNTGAATSEKIVATLRIPTGCTYLGGLDDAQIQGNLLKWSIHALAPGASRNYQFRCNMASTGEHLFAFDCRGTAAGNAGVSIATRVESIADLVLTVVDPTAPAPIGSEVVYEIIVHNRGSKEATDVRAVAQFSHGIEPRRIEGQSGEVVTGQVLFDAIPRIGAGQEVRMRVIAEADKPGHHRFRTEVRSGDTVLVAEEATHYMSPKSERVSRRSTDAKR